MYLIPVEVKASPIDGNGVFTLQDIPAGKVVWKFDPSHDKTLTQDAFTALTEEEKEALKRIAYLSKHTGRWVYPPSDDPARYTNHSDTNNLSVMVDESISEEPLFVANRAITKGEELTNNYREFDTFAENLEADWVQ